MNEDFCKSVHVSNAPPHELKLCEGMECYITRNLCPDDGLLNNTLVEVLSITRNLKKVLVSTGKIHYIPRINFTLELPRKMLSVLRKQFPLRAAYVRTVNRSQGATLDRSGLDLREEPFAHGQLLVALSRVRTSKDICILLNEDSIIDEKTFKTRNVAYHELLE